MMMPSMPIQRHLGHVGKAGIVEIGHHFHQQRRAFGRVGHGGVAHADPRWASSASVSAPAPAGRRPRVGRDVADDIIGEPAGGGNAGGVILQRVLALLVLPDVGAEDALAARRTALASR